MKTRFATITLALAMLAGCEAEPAPEQAAATPEAAAPQAELGTANDGSAFDAATYLPCSFDGIAAVDGCEAGVVRDWGEDGGALVEVTKPDGFTRAIFVGADGVPFSADSAEADGSAGWDFATRMEGGRHIVDFGPEHYEFAEEFVSGG